MIIGVPREIKPMERRVALVPSGVRTLVAHGHRVLVETGAGSGSAYADEQYLAAGAEVIGGAGGVFAQADLILKVKEPLPSEYGLIREGQVVFTFFHFAASLELTRAMLGSRCVAVAYEALEARDGSLPVLSPMSEIAGRLAVQIGCRYLESTQGGVGRLLGGATGVERCQVVVVGGGIVGEFAARTAAGLGADVTVLEKDHLRIRQLNAMMPANVRVLYSDPSMLAIAVAAADLLVGAVLSRGRRTPHIVTKDMVAAMRPGAVIIDVSVDQGGCVETIRPTTHVDPVYEWHGVRHYGVANIPAAAARTATEALTSTTIEPAVLIADLGSPACFAKSALLRTGLVMAEGELLSEAVSATFNLPLGRWKVSSSAEGTGKSSNP